MKLKQKQAIVYFGIQISLQVIITLSLVLNFEKNCENKEYLTWDPELRFVYTLNIFSLVKQQKIGEFLKAVLDTPTWPPLRSLIQVILFSVYKESPLLDVYLSVFWLILLDFFLGFAAWRLGKTLIEKWLGLIITKIIFLSPALLLYSFSGMLEAQGSLFLSITSYYFCYVFIQEKLNTKVFKLYVLSFLALYFTKYPYGYMFLVSAGILLLLQERDSVRAIILRFVKIKFRFHILGFLALALLVIYSMIPSVYLAKKIPKYFKYSIGLFIFLEVVFFFFLERGFIQKVNIKIWSFFISTFLPVGLWTFIHPDRFGSSTGTVEHIQMEGHLVGEIVKKDWNYYLFFWKVLFKDVWNNTTTNELLPIVFVLTLIFKFAISLKKRSNPSSLLILGIIVLHIIQVTFFTENHQARHVYHLLPLLVLYLLFTIREIFTKWISIILALVLTSILISKSGQIMTYLQTTNLCFSGKGNFYKPVEDIKPYLNQLITEDVYLLNEIEKGHLHRMNVEYVVARIAHKKELKFFKKPPFQMEYSIIYIGRKCRDKLENFENFLLIQKAQTDEFCVSKFSTNNK